MICKRCSNDKGNLVGVRFHCPGCNEEHVMAHPRWHWNGSLESPTFAPSLVIEWKDDDGKVYARCHSQITDGQIAFMPDSTHSLAGMTVPLPPLEGLV